VTLQPLVFPGNRKHARSGAAHAPRRRPAAYVFRYALLGVLLAVSLLSARPASAFEPDQEGHLGITSAALAATERVVGGETVKFSNLAIAQIRQANANTDWNQVDSALHFDNENFDGGTRRLVELKQSIIAAIIAPSPDGDSARRDLGGALHTLQDFYSHTNWVELGHGPTEIDTRLGREIYGGLPLDQPTSPANDPGTLCCFGLESLTSGWITLPNAPCTPPPGKTRHGVALLSLCPAGLNKDDVTRTGYVMARLQAIEASKDYINQILGDPRVAGNATAIRALMTVGGLTNMGFESGNFASWSQGTVVEGVAVTGADNFAAPYEGGFMARLGGTSFSDQPIGPNAIFQDFIVDNETESFVYNVFTYDYTGFDEFRFTVFVIQPSNGQVLAAHEQGAWGEGTDLKSSGWTGVTLDLTGHVGQTVRLAISAGGTLDSLYSFWAYVDSASSGLPPVVAPLGSATSPNGSVMSDPQTGQVTIAMPSGQRTPVTITSPIACPGGRPASSAVLRLNGAPYLMSESPPGSGSYTGTIPASEVESGVLTIDVVCPNGNFVTTIGQVFLYDPSGTVIDAHTQQPVVGAKVKLFNVPGWTAKTGPNDLTTNTCESNLSKAAGVPWSQPAPTSLGVEANPYSGLIAPKANPFITNALGYYGWDVAAGCWYVTLEKEGYESLTSPVVGVPPAVLDLNLKLTPKPVDSQPPTTGAVSAPPPNLAGWLKSDATVNLTAIDNAGGSGVKFINYYSSGAQPFASTTVHSASATIPITTEGQTTLSFYATDKAGNVEAPKSTTVKLDKTPPGPTAASVAGGTPAGGGWYTASPTITLASVDTTSGLAAIHYRFVPRGAPAPGNALPDGWTPYTAPVTAPGADTDLYAFATDNAGNAEVPVMLGRFKLAVLVTFNDRAGQEQSLNGEYPAGVIHWGVGRWFHAGPWEKLGTKHFTFKGDDGVKSASFTLLRPRRVVSLRAYNERSTAATLTLRCDGPAGLLEKQVVLAGRQVVTVETGWETRCDSVTLASTNGWDTHFDDLVLEALPPPEPTPSVQTVTFNDLAGGDRVLNGRDPAGLVDFGRDLWWLSGPEGAMPTKHLSMNGPVGVTTATLVFPTPRRLVSVDAYNVGAPTTITLRCAGQPDVAATLDTGQFRVVRTGWGGACGAVTVASGNGWDTDFDNLVVEAASP
jgi:hypothetical protein